MRRLDQAPVRQPVVARVVGGRNHALVHPEQMYAIPVEGAGRELVEQRSDSGPAGDGEGHHLTAGKGIVEQRDDIARASLGSGGRIGSDDRSGVHTIAAAASRAAVASVRSNTGSRRTIPSSSRISRQSVGCERLAQLESAPAWTLRRSSWRSKDTRKSPPASSSRRA